MYEDRIQIITQKFMKNMSYMRHPFPGHIIYSHMQTGATIFCSYCESNVDF